jgi:hypothetical protein
MMTASGQDSMLEMTDHARRRLAQRGLRADHVAYVLDHGTVECRTGVTFVVLRRRDIPPEERGGDAAHLEGTVILLSNDGEAITAYRNRTAFADIRRKTKYRRHTATRHRSNPDGDNLA